MSTVSARKGIGSIYYKDGTSDGTTFRVWAPFATEVSVGIKTAGDPMNAYATYPLSSEGNDYWSADVAEAKLNNRYRYLIKGPFTVAEGQWRTDPYCRYVEDNDNGDGIICIDDFNWGTEAFYLPPLNELVIYEVHVASFRNEDDAVGDFGTLINKLDYLQDLGINAIEILPIFGFPGDYSWGYNPDYPFDIESNYGSPSTFKRLIHEAHKRGIAVILDVVYNHFGQYEFGDEELDYCLGRFDGWYENNKNGIYFYNNWRSKTAFGSRPDYGREAVREFIKDNVMMWLEEYRIDGLRFDSTVNIRNVEGRNNDAANDIAEGWLLMQKVNNEKNHRQPWKYTIAEDLQDNEWITKETYNRGAGFNAQWDSYFFWTLNRAITAVSDEARNMHEVQDIIQHTFQGDAFKRVIYINNHDECGSLNNKYRLSDRIWLGHADSWFVRKRYTLAIAIVLTTPGVPMFFQGDEFLESGQWSDQKPLDWDKREQFSGIWNLYQSLIRLRRNWFNNTRGLKGQHVNVFHVNDTAKVIAYHRWEKGDKGDDVIVVANFANRSYDSYTIGFPQEGVWHVRFNSDWNGYSHDFDNHPGYDTTAVKADNKKDGLNYVGNVGIGAYSVLILSQ
jgi:1,4-alpha-glucan branching enzyme